MQVHMLTALVDRARYTYPGYFALVMATGIVGIACYLMQMPEVGYGLFHLNIIFYIVLWILLVIKLICHMDIIKSEFVDHSRGPTFFTVIAGTCVLGSQFAILNQKIETAISLWILGVILWFVLVYGLFSSIIVLNKKPPLDIGINGSWLITIVATQSVSILGTLVSSAFEKAESAILFFSLVMYLLGGMLYILIICILFYRVLFYRFTPESMTPPYWIGMGSVAITTLAGDRLILNAEHWLFLIEILPFLKGFTLFFWATATWWIPLIIILGIWRHIQQKLPIRYDPQYWSMVFPIGMYTVCTLIFAKANNLSFLIILPRVFIYLALFVWTLAFLGMVRRTFAEMQRLSSR